MFALLAAVHLTAPSGCPTPVVDDSAYGQSIASCGDLDGDGYSEIAIGSPYAGDHREGVVVIYSGYRYGELRVLRGDIPDSGFGTALAAVGDQDGDGIPDLAVSAPLPGPKGAFGEIQIRSGKTGACIRRYVAADDETYFGLHITAIGDLDGDKRPDLLIHCLKKHVPRDARDLRDSE
jgi:hypothetical protein